MVLEQLFKVKFMERKSNAFFIGALYSFLGILSAGLIFPQNIGLMSVAFTSLLLSPSLSRLLMMEENVEIREKKLSIISLFKDHKDIFIVYLFLFLGMFVAFSTTALIISKSVLISLFQPQFDVANISGNAFMGGKLIQIVLNNLLIFVVAFLLSIIYGAGSVLFLTWNASVWGILFGYFVQIKTYGSTSISGYATKILPFLPHMITEALAYISAAIVGGVVSKAVLREKFLSKKFKHIMTDALIFLFIGILLVLISGIIEVYYYDKLRIFLLKIF